VELATGLLFVAVTLTLTPLWWPVGFFLVALLVVVAVYDIYHLVIPQLFVWLLFLIALVIVGMRYYLVPDWWQVGSHILAGLLAYGFFAGLWKMSAGRWIGYGDAKLALPLGLIVGLTGTFSMIVLSFWVGTIISLGLLFVGRLRQKQGKTHLRFVSVPLTMKSEVPFAPFLIIGFLLVYLGQVDVLTLISYALPL
jgi:prepilin signal peptidase PulO-like enzyme (type II secretory pathway)